MSGQFNSTNTDGRKCELLERIRPSVPAEERGAPALPVGDADISRIRTGRHGRDSDCGDYGDVHVDVGSPRLGRGTRVSGVHVGPPKASETQVGGDHYKSLAIQPTEYIERNSMTWSQGNIIKYATRYKKKNGARDIAKVIHYAMLILEQEYGTTFEEVMYDEQ